MLVDQQLIEKIAASVPGGLANIQDIKQASSCQSELLSRHLIGGEVAAKCVISLVLAVSSWDQLEDLTVALQWMINSSDVLRTAVQWKGLPRAFQIVFRRANLPAEEVRLRRDDDHMMQIRDWLKPTRQSMDVSIAPLMRVRAAPHSSKKEWYIWIQFHRLVIGEEFVAQILQQLGEHFEGAKAIRPRVIFGEGILFPS